MSTDMIVKELPRIATGDSGVVKKFKTTTTTYYPSMSGSNVVAWQYNEDKRRDAIIAELVRKSQLAPGMLVRPANDDTYQLKGLATITAIASTYAEWKGNLEEKDVKWPPGDNPMIVHARYEDDGFCVEATINYFIPFEKK